MTDPRVSFAPGIDRDAATAEAIAVLQREGVVVLDDLVDAATIARCRAEIEARYPELATPDRERNYGPYEGRHCMPMAVEGMLAAPDIFLNPVIKSMAKKLLGANFLIDSIGLLVAIPGAPDQKPHSDATLFGEGFDRLLPPFALAVSMPLVRMDEASGRTAFWRGSHRKPAADGAHDYAPVVEPGAVLIWDFRIKHCGLANSSAAPRPTIFTVLSRHWWVEVHPPEATRYEKLLVARATFDAQSPRMKHRLNRARLVDPAVSLEPLRQDHQTC